MRPLARSPALFLIVASAAFATSGPLARAARPTHPLVIAFGRVALAAVVLFALDPAGIVLSMRRMTRRQRGAVVLAGALLAAHFALFTWGLDQTSLPAAISLVSLEPLSVLLFAWAFHRARPSRIELVGVGLATVGAVIVGRSAGAGEHKILGDLLVLGAVALYGAYVAVARGVRDALAVRHYACLVYGFAAAVLAVAIALSGATIRSAASTRGVLSIVALALVPTIVGHTAVQAAARDLSPSVVALVSPGETLGGILIGVTLMHALPTGFELLGALVIVAGATISLVGTRG